MECFLNPTVSCDFLVQYKHMIWIGLGIFLCTIEIFIPGIFVVFFGIGALVVGGLVYFFSFSFLEQIIIWLIISIGTMLIGAKFLHKIFPSDSKKEPSNFKNYENKIALVTKKINPNKSGRIQFQGTEWEAKSQEEILVGEYAKILTRENISFLVTKANSEEVENFLASKRKIEED